MKDYIGNPLQIRGAEQYILQNGKGDGMHFLNIRNGLGLEIWISLDRAGEDITRFPTVHLFQLVAQTVKRLSTMQETWV